MTRSTVLSALAAIAPILLPCLAHSEITFARDVAPLLQKHCQECHRPGQAAPMSLLTYAEVRPWAKSIQEKVTSREMPPFHAAGNLGRYVDDPRLTDDEIATIANWVKAGAPLGDAADLPAPKTWTDAEWIGGTPDLVVTMPRYEIRTDGIDDNVDIYSEFTFPEDLWVRAVEVRPSNRRALHHANVFLTLPDEAIPESLYSHEMKGDLLKHPFLVQWLPGRTFEAVPDGQAIHLFAGRRILLNAHYVPSTEVEFDETRVGLYFASGTIDTLTKQLGVMTLTLPKPIEPNESDYVLTFRQQFTADARVTDFHFHMHYRGSGASVEFQRPDGVMIPGIDVPRYDFNWQRKYTLAEPLDVPKDTVAIIKLKWDNSAGNPGNPDPSKQVKFGLLTTEEMGIAEVWYLDSESKLDPPFIVQNGRRMDAPATSVSSQQP